MKRGEVLGRSPSLYGKLHAKHWERKKGIDFPGGRVAVRDEAGRVVIHREHGRRELREMARLAARREMVEMRSVEFRGGGSGV